MYEIIQMTDCDLPIHRIEAWYACLNRVEEFWDCFLSQPNEHLPNLPFMSWLHTVHILLVVAKLSFIPAEGWDLDYVRTKCSFATLTDRLIEKLSAVSKLEIGFPSPRPLAIRFNLYAEKMRMCKRWYEAKLKAEEAVKASEQAAAFAGRSAIPGPASPDLNCPGLFDSFDDTVWQDFVYDWAAPMQF
jgi:hypothetical protein